MVAPTLLRRLLWPAAAAAAAAALLLLALPGERPDRSIGRFEPAGVMLHLPPAEISRLEIASGARRWSFVREPSGWRAVEAAAPPPMDAAQRIETALRLLHGSAPERILAGAELAERASFGLDPPALRVIVNGRERFAVAFGAANPLGLARYAQVEGRAEVALVPGYVPEAFEAAVGLR